MADTKLSLTDKEQKYLSSLLETKLGETRVEVHRTHTPDYRDQVEAEEKLIRGLIAKLGSNAGQA